MIKEFFRQNRWLIVAGAVYLVFGAILIARSSTDAGGQRYYSLFDDAMISLRYADNLVSGHGLTWNPGERIEGFTNPLMVALMAIFVLVFGRVLAIPALQVFGLFTVGLILALTFLLYRRAGGRAKYFEIGLFVLFAGFYPVLFWPIAGMETGLLTLLVLLAGASWQKESRLDRLNWQLPLVLSLAVLTRPETVLFAAFLFAWRFVENPSCWRYRLSEGLLFLLPPAAYQWFRLSYYGEWYPNTYLLKATGMPLLDRLKNGALYLSANLRYLFPLILFLLAYVGATFSRLSAIKQIFIGQDKLIYFGFAAFLVYSAYQIWVGGDPWPPMWRFTVPYTVLLFIAFTYAASRLEAELASRQFALSLFISAVAIATFFALAAYRSEIISLRPFTAAANYENARIGQAVNELTTEEATVASVWAGTIPYYAERKAIDPLGKIDPYIARLAPDLSGAVAWGKMYSVPGHNKYDFQYSFVRQNPTYVGSLPCSRLKWGKDDLHEWCEQNYDFVSYKGVNLLLRKNSPAVLWELVKN